MTATPWAASGRDIYPLSDPKKKAIGRMDSELDAAAIVACVNANGALTNANSILTVALQTIAERPGNGPLCVVLKNIARDALVKVKV